jgi:lysozyme
MEISSEGIALIKKFEGCEKKAYRCAANVLTIGYGHTKDVTEDMEITQEEAENMLRHELIDYCNYVDMYVEVPLEQHQFDSLVSWTYNLGPTNLKSSTLLKVLNGKDYEGVPAQIKRWNKANGEVKKGLIRRREAEALMFENKEWYEV